MQQRFTKMEMKKFQITKVVSAADLRLHPWFTGDPSDGSKKGASIDG